MRKAADWRACSVAPGLWRSTAGLWGPLAFGLSAIAAGRRQPGYDHRRDYVSGLAARATRSAPVMIPGFVALGTANLVTRSDDPVMSTLRRIAGAGTIAAGLVRCSDVRCPDPLTDTDATGSDAAHAAASIATFVTWTALPFVSSSRTHIATDRAIDLAFGAMTALGFLASGTCARRRAPNTGLVQRLFLSAVFAWHAVTAVRVLAAAQHARYNDTERQHRTATSSG